MPLVESDKRHKSHLSLSSPNNRKIPNFRIRTNWDERIGSVKTTTETRVDGPYESCAAGDAKYKAHPTKCDHYLQCILNMYYVDFKCPMGMYWNDVNKFCDESSIDNCTKKRKKPATGTKTMPSKPTGTNSGTKVPRPPTKSKTIMDLWLDQDIKRLTKNRPMTTFQNLYPQPAKSQSEESAEANSIAEQTFSKRKGASQVPAQKLPSQQMERPPQMKIRCTNRWQEAFYKRKYGINCRDLQQQEQTDEQIKGVKQTPVFGQRRRPFWQIKGGSKGGVKTPGQLPEQLPGQLPEQLPEPPTKGIKSPARPVVPGTKTGVKQPQKPNRPRPRPPVKNPPTTTIAPPTTTEEAITEKVTFTPPPTSTKASTDYITEKVTRLPSVTDAPPTTTTTTAQPETVPPTQPPTAPPTEPPTTTQAPTTTSTLPPQLPTHSPLVNITTTITTPAPVETTTYKIILDENANCPDPGSRFKDPDDCQCYYECQLNKRLTRTCCPEGLFFNQIDSRPGQEQITDDTSEGDNSVCDLPTNVDSSKCKSQIVAPQ